VALLFAAPGCDSRGSRSHDKDAKAADVPEREEPRFVEAGEMTKGGLHDAALNAYLELIRARADGAPESQFAAGYIYLTQKRRPENAIYHFEEFLRRSRDPARARQVNSLADSARKMLFAQRVPGFNDNHAALEKIDELSRMNAVLTRQNNDLKKINAGLQRQLAASPTSRATPSLATPAAPLPPLAVYVATPPPSQPGTAVPLPTSYTVTKGDNLFKISAKVYGNAGRWLEIYNANRGKLKNERDLKLGTELRIPRP
jgi:LysM repeat protein